MLNVEVLRILLAKREVGKLFRFNNGTTSPIIRFVAEDSFATDQKQDTLSVSMLARDPTQQASFWRDVSAEVFNGTEGRLPVFFQNQLPEGVFRTQLAQERGCREDDHFALFAACGRDLPGALTAEPVEDITREELAHLVTQDNDALEFSVIAEPLQQGVSISGMQPKLGLIEQGGRYVARKRLGVTRIIGKLPQLDRILLPEVEHLSLSLAAAAGANVCEHKLVPLTRLDFEHGYTLGGSSNFLAVTRFDRDGAKRIHCEDFAQAMGVDPRLKYTGATYAGMGALMLRFNDSLGIPAVHEMLRLITVNELLGNYDGHLKNFVLIYRDGKTPELSPAFDIVAWTVYYGGSGNALTLYRKSDVHSNRAPGKTLSPASLRDFCNVLGIAEQPCVAVIRKTVKNALKSWPEMIEASQLNPGQREKLQLRLQTHPLAAGVVKRSLKMVA